MQPPFTREKVGKVSCYIKRPSSKGKIDEQHHFVVVLRIAPDACHVRAANPLDFIHT